MNNYQLNEEVGKGAFSTVYKGRKRKTVDYYAISSIDKSRRPRVLTCVQTLRALHHPNVLQFHNWYETTHHLWVITEYCPGGTLRAVLDSDNKMKESSVRAFGRDIAQGLFYVHTRSTLCNDLKPSNLLMDTTATMRFYDFGLSCNFQTASERKPIGTPLYMAPELFMTSQGGVASTASDLWSLGCVLYELGSGQAPFKGKDLEDLLTKIMFKPPATIPGASKAFNSLVERLLIKDPLKRATWSDVAASEFWGAPLQLQVENVPQQVAFAAYQQEWQNRGMWSDEAMRNAITLAVNSAKHNFSTAQAATGNQEEPQEDMRLDKEIDFTPRPGDVVPRRSGRWPMSADTFPVDVKNEATHSAPLDGALASGADGSNSDNAGTPQVEMSGIQSQAAGNGGFATSRRSGLARGEDAGSKQTTPNPTGAGRRPSTSGVNGEERMTKAQLEAFGGAILEKVKVQDLLWHASDAHIRPLCMNSRIERYTSPSFSTTDLPFRALSVREVKALGGEKLAQFITDVFRPLSSTSTSYESKLNILRYLQTISADADSANGIVNSSIMTHCAKFAAQQSSPVEFRVAAASIMGIAVRYATFIYEDLAKSRILPNLMEAFLSEGDTTVRRKLIACIGELLFYVAVQQPQDRPPWGIVAADVQRVFVAALETSDDIIRHYATQVIENLSSVAYKDYSRDAFCTPKVVGLLLRIYKLRPSSTCNEHMRSTAVCAALKLALIKDELIPTVLESDSFPISEYRVFFEVVPTPAVRTAQMLLTFFLYALVKGMVTKGSPFMALWANNDKGSGRKSVQNGGTGSSSAGADKDLEPSPFASSSLSTATADKVLDDMVKISDCIIERLCDGNERSSVAIRGKAQLYVMFLGCLDGTIFAKLCSARNVQYLDRLMQDKDKYVSDCSTALASYMSVFVAEKLESVSRRVSSSSTSVYLSASQQIISAGTIRERLELQPRLFRSLGESVEKALNDTLYRPYEDELNNVSERIVQSPQMVLRYADLICSHLVRPYAEMLKRNEAKQRFCAVRILVSAMVPLASDPKLAQDENGPVARAARQVVLSVAAVLPLLLKDFGPTPSNTLRLLDTCVEWMPSTLAPIVSESFVDHLLTYINQTSDGDISYALSVTLRALKVANRDDLVAFSVQKKLLPLLGQTIVSASDEAMDHVVECCCELAAYVLQQVSTAQSTRTTQLCLTTLDVGSVKKAFLPVCKAGDAVAESAATAVLNYVRLAVSAPQDRTFTQRIDGIVAMLAEWVTQALPAVQRTQTMERLLRALRVACEVQSKEEVSRLNRDDRFVGTLRGLSLQDKTGGVGHEASQMLLLLNA